MQAGPKKTSQRMVVSLLWFFHTVIPECHTLIIVTIYDDVFVHQFAVDSYVNFSRYALKNSKIMFGTRSDILFFRLGRLGTTTSEDIKCSIIYTVF